MSREPWLGAVQHSEGQSLDGSLPSLPPVREPSPGVQPVTAWPRPQQPVSTAGGTATPPAPLRPAPALGEALRALQPVRRSPVRVQVRRMSLLMELKLRKNDFKGGWANVPAHKLLDLLEAEVKELREAVESGDPLDIAQECADVANYAMMVADVSEGI